MRAAFSAWFVIRRAAAVAALAACAALPAAAQNAANGGRLYESVCIVCHGFPPAGGPERAANNPSLIQSAIDGRVAAMSFLRSVLTASDIADIAAWLANPTLTPAAPTPAHDYSDLWWNPAEDGWGLNLIQHPSHVVFGVMYTYDANRKAMWLVLPGGQWTTSTTYTGALYRVTGPGFNASTFNPANVNVRQVGNATLAFSSRDRGTWSFSVDGVLTVKPIERQPF